VDLIVKKLLFYQELYPEHQLNVVLFFEVLVLDELVQVEIVHRVNQLDENIFELFPHVVFDIHQILVSSI
jgi:hypothetical protein